MNLYVAGWDLTEQEQVTATDSLREVACDYPSLDADSLWRAPEGRAFAACIQSNTAARGSRQYIYQKPDEIVLFDGCMVDIDGRLNAMCASELSANWEILPARLEGRFSILRIRPQTSEMELLTDFMGMTQVFHATVNGKLIISNSVRVLTRICQDSALDPLGASLMLSLGWPSGDRTLNQAVQIVPGGAHWRWGSGAQTKPVQPQSASPAHLVGLRKKKFKYSEAGKLSDCMVAMLRTLGNSYKLQCPLTGGRDTRLLLALLLRGRLSAEYYTDASTNPEDLDTAIALANRFHLSHRVHRPSADIPEDQWDTLTARLVRQNDGMVGLWQLADIMPETYGQAEMPVRLFGIGGEIARRFYANPSILLLKRGDINGAARWLGNKLHDYNGIVREPAMALSHQFLRDWVAQAADAGYSTAEMPDVFYTFERVRRWAGAGASSRKVQNSFDLFAPLCTRPFVEAAFRLPVLNRFAEPLHYQLIRLIPELHRMPFGGDSWLTQMPSMALPQLIIRKKILPPLARKLRLTASPKETRSFDISEVLMSNLPKIRTFCMDHAKSPLWEFVDRNRFEQITAPDFERSQLTLYTEILSQIATLFYYEAFQG